MDELAMEIREVRTSERLIVGVVAPYDEVSYLVPDPAGERICRGAFARSINNRGDKIPLLRGHDRIKRMGVSREFSESAEGLIGTFVVNRGAEGDELLEQSRDGYYGALSAGFVPNGHGRGADGVREIREAKLVEVSLLAVPAYEGAAMLAVRSAQDLEKILEPFRARPDVNLAPLPPILYRPH